MSYTIQAQTRTEIGKGSSRRLRHAGKVPAVIYGQGKEPVSIVFDWNLFDSCSNFILEAVSKV